MLFTNVVISTASVVARQQLSVVSFGRCACFYAAGTYLCEIRLV